VLLVVPVLVVVILLWNRSKVPSLLHHFHWKWAQGEIQVDTPSGTWRYHWSAMSSCKISGQFLRMRLNNGTSYHVPTRAFTSDSELDEVIRLSNSATNIDVRPATTTTNIDVRPATEERH
jgi:YcxB-like protein